MKTLSAIKKAVFALNKTTQAIDPSILDVLIGLRAFNIPTQSSCAGHDDRKGSFPYVDIYSDDSDVSYDDFSGEMIRIKKRWIRNNIALQNTLIALLTEYYQTRKVHYKYHLSPHTMIDWAGVRLKSIGADLLQNMSARQFRKELPVYQLEMQCFGVFLIGKYKTQRDNSSLF